MNFPHSLRKGTSILLCSTMVFSQLVGTVHASALGATVSAVLSITNNDGGTLSVSDVQGQLDAMSYAWGDISAVTAGSHAFGLASTPAGYDLSYSGDCDSVTGVVDVVDGDAKSCTVILDDQAVPPIDPPFVATTGTLTVIVVMQNTHGGTAAASDFVYGIDATSPSLTTATGSDIGTDISMDAGNYAVTYTPDSRYEVAFGKGCDGTMNAGETVSCTLTFQDVPGTITVRKNLIQDNETTNFVASDFSFTVNATNPSTSTVIGNVEGESVTVDAGDYSVTENDSRGMAVSYSEECSGAIDLGETRVCTVTNDDMPVIVIMRDALRVMTVINNANGGSLLPEGTQYDFSTGDGTSTETGSSEPQDYKLGWGGYAVIPHGVTGYSVALTGDCSREDRESRLMASMVSETPRNVCTITYTSLANETGKGGIGASNGIPPISYPSFSVAPVSSTEGTGNGSPSSTGGAVLGDTDSMDACTAAGKEAQDLAHYVDRVVLNGTPLSQLFFKGLTQRLLAKITETDLVLVSKVTVANFIENGSTSTMHLGEGERAGIINSFKAIYGKYPSTACEWQDVVDMGSDKVPMTKNAVREMAKKTVFKGLFGRENKTDDQRTLDLMTYGLRPMSRDLGKEASGITRFAAHYGHSPITSDDWDLARALAYGFSAK